MPMTEMQVGDQTVRYDREATAAIYARLKNGWAEDCGCVGCRNLLAQRDVIYQASDSPYFKYHFSRVGPCPQDFRDGPKICIEFEAHFKWILNESWESERRWAMQ
jgi:hypothetical protein